MCVYCFNCVCIVLKSCIVVLLVNMCVCHSYNKLTYLLTYLFATCQSYSWGMGWHTTSVDARITSQHYMEARTFQGGRTQSIILGANPPSPPP